MKSFYRGARQQEWSTPQELYDELDAEFSFTLDPCATPENAKCKKFYTKEDDGLTKRWAGERVFMNPPYGREVRAWVEKAYLEKDALTVGLLPARTDTSWFHDYVYGGGIEIRFLRGRIKFSGAGSSPFPSMVVVWK